MVWVCADEQEKQETKGGFACAAAALCVCVCEREREMLTATPLHLGLPLRIHCTGRLLFHISIYICKDIHEYVRLGPIMRNHQKSLLLSSFPSSESIATTITLRGKWCIRALCVRTRRLALSCRSKPYIYNVSSAYKTMVAPLPASVLSRTSLSASPPTMPIGKRAQ